MAVTVVRWHGAAFRLYWHWLSRRMDNGRPKISSEVRELLERKQAVSIVWAGVRSGDHLTAEDVILRSAGTIDAETLHDMLSNGILRQIGSALVLNDEWTDLGDQRLIHTVIAGPGGVPMIEMAPDIVESIMEGRQPAKMTFQDFQAHLPNDWAAQRQLLGFSAK